MPRRSSGPRLYLDRKRGQWVVRDGSAFVRTGAGASDRGAAERALQEYIASKYRPAPSADPLIDDVLSVYGDEHAPHTSRPKETAYQIAHLLGYWGGKRVGYVSARTCRGYAGGLSQAAARRNLETLRAAIHYWHREYGPLPSIPKFTLPAKPQPRERWLTREEAAKLLWAARRTPHLARFILIGLYTGTRSGAILSLTWKQVDLEQAILHRRQPRQAETKKRQPPVRVGRSLLSHLRRWRALDAGRSDRVVHYDGAAVTKLRRSWTTARKRAGLDPLVTPHALRHTRATWLMQRGVPIWEAAGSLGMTVETLEKTYGHHSPDWQKNAASI